VDERSRPENDIVLTDHDEREQHERSNPVFAEWRSAQLAASAARRFPIADRKLRDPGPTRFLFLQMFGRA
jgi:hypothetical protein